MAEQEITRLLQNWVAGDSASLDRLTPMVYQHLHRIAANAFRGERADHTLQTTALVHEAYAKLVDIDIDWQDRSHFFALAARLMRRILVDHAKTKGAKRRGEGNKALPLDDVIVVTPEVGDEILDLHEALNQLAERDPRKAEMLELQFFGGLTYEEMSEVLNLSRSTLDRDLRFAKAWLGNQLKKTMSERRPPYFSVGEVAILQPPHPSAKHLWGTETTILEVFWSGGGEDAMGQNSPKWSYLTDVPAPPPTDLPEDQHDGWVWCEYDLRKKQQPGESFEAMMERLSEAVTEREF